MIVLLIGLFVIVIGVLAMSYPDFVSTLKEEDSANWNAIGSPPPYAFSKTIGVYSWLQSKGYESSGSANVRALGEKYRNKAQFTKVSLIAGSALVIVGFGLSLAGY